MNCGTPRPLPYVIDTLKQRPEDEVYEMKDSWLWEEADIQSLIANQIQEGLSLDYKRCDSLQKTDGKKKEISKDVSAFANSAGGTIVYGIVEDKHVPTGIDDGYDPKDISKEWIEQVINSTIEQRIDGVRIKEIGLSGAKAGRSIYVVYVPRSTRAPHMASDNRYYKRFNFESVPMEDYEVRDVSRRLEVPDLYVEFRPAIPDRFEPDPNTPDRLKPITVQMVTSNKSPAVAGFAFFSYCIDASSIPGKANANNVIKSRFGSVPVVVQKIEWRGAMRLPLWQNHIVELARFQIAIPSTSGGCILFWEALAPLMRRKTGLLVIEPKFLRVSPYDEEWNFEKEMIWQV